MWYPAVAIDDVADEPVTLAEAKKQVHAEYHADDDDYLNRLIAAARDHVEAYTGTHIAQRDVVVKCDCFADFAWFPEAPVRDVVVKYVDTDGAEQTLSADVYELRADGLEASIALKHGQAWPAVQPGSRITVEAEVGYETPPPAVKHAMLIFISDSFEQREPATSGGRTTFDDLLSNFRR